MFAGRRFDIEIGLYYNRARYYNPFTGRFLQTDPIGYGDGINLYAYCGNNPLAFADPSGLSETYADIPMFAIPCFENDATAQALVESWLSDVGFFDEYNWTVTDVNIVDGNFRVYFAPCGKWTEFPTFGNIMVGGVPVVTIDGIGRLDSGDRTLNMIIAGSIHAQNLYNRPLIPTVLPTQLNPFKIADLIHKLFGSQTPFAEDYDSPQKWYYKGKKYDKSEVNYILMGHAMKHQKVAHYLGVSLARLWKKAAWGHNAFPEGALYWFTKGYGEYGERADW